MTENEHRLVLNAMNVAYRDWLQFPVRDITVLSRNLNTVAALAMKTARETKEVKIG